MLDYDDANGEIIDQVAIDRVLAAEPNTRIRLRLTPAEKRECMRQAIARGIPPADIGKRMGINGQTIAVIRNEITTAA